MRINKVLIKPIITEKSIALNKSQGVYTFEVDLYASQGAIRQALRDVYGVDVYDLHTHVLPGKRRRVARTHRFRTTPMRKRALFRIRNGKLDIYQGE